MKKNLTVILLTIFLNVSLINNVEGQGESFNISSWVDQNFQKGKVPPFSFNYGGKNSDSFITRWQFSRSNVREQDSSVKETVYTYYDRITRLTVKCNVRIYSDYPAVEWVLKFSNSSPRNSLLLSQVAVADHSFKLGEKGTFILHHSKGSNAERSDFQMIDDPMTIGKNIYLTPSGGRSSDNTAFPFFNIEAPGNEGIVAAVGWTGKWYADIKQVDENTVTLKSGMEKMSLQLYPGEEIRTPEICLLFWRGNNRMAGNNLFRRFVLAHHSRMINGTFADYPLSGSFDYGDPAPCNEYNCLTEDYAISLVKRYEMFNVLPELFWLDAGWYTGCGWNKKNGDWWQNVGNWTPDTERFPHGLKAVSDEVHRTGARFMVWFEPERVRPGTMIDNEHPEWLIKLPGNDNYLFNMGDQKARIWLTDYISDFLKKEGIDYYRQDFNFNPYPYWEANDKADRIGISEIKHIEGLYAFWDSLLVRFPQLLIDNCASGGRRIDLETISRSAPLWRTDYQYGEPNGYQCHTFGLNFYIPIHGTAIYRTDSYTFRSGLGGTAVMNWEVTGRTSEAIPAVQKRISEYKELRPFYYGDYYPLTATGNNTGDNVWLAYQLDRPEKGDGIILAFRRQSCDVDSLRTKLYGLQADAQYDLFFEDYGLHVKLRGGELMDHFSLSIPQKPGSLLVRYRIIQ